MLLPPLLPPAALPGLRARACVCAAASCMQGGLDGAEAPVDERRGQVLGRRRVRLPGDAPTPTGGRQATTGHFLKL